MISPQNITDLQIFVGERFYSGIFNSQSSVRFANDKFWELINDQIDLMLKSNSSLKLINLFAHDITIAAF